MRGAAGAQTPLRRTAMIGWDSWKKGFDAWEDATAKHLEAEQV